jgi:hypothetical protein
MQELKLDLSNLSAIFEEELPAHGLPQLKQPFEKAFGANALPLSGKMQESAQSGNLWIQLVQCVVHSEYPRFQLPSG